MEQKIEYFRFRLFGDRWQETAALGSLVFQNKNGIVKPNNVLCNLIFHFVVDVDRDLEKLEQYFIERGFSSVPAEMIDSNRPVEYIGLTKQPTSSVRCFDHESAIEYIDKSFRCLDTEMGGAKVMTKTGMQC